MSLDTQYRYIMTDFQGRQVGNTYESYVPLVNLGQDMKETNDLVLWQVDENLTRRVIGVITPSTTSKVKSFRWS